MVPSQHPEQLPAPQVAFFDAAQTPPMQARPEQQLKFSSQRDPARLQPPSHLPRTQEPEQQSAAREQVVQFGLQRQNPPAQYLVQH